MNYTPHPLNSWADATTERRAPRRNGDSWPARDSASGRVLAKRWTISRTLGIGGTGTVYEAEHRNGRRVAVKVLHPDLAHHPTIRKRFCSEGYAANRVRHPDAVAVLDDGEEADGTVFLVMELLEGHSLAKLLSERGALPVQEVVAAALSTLEVLAAAHDNGVVHRDVKPGNIFATFDGKIKLLDFGVAQVADAASSVITQTGGTVGTPAFMAPEQAAGREIDALTDIWAVGATMFQLLTQRLVHDAPSKNGTIVAAATLPAPLVRSVAPHVPAAIAKVIDRALAFERSERWPNARAMHLALRNACPEGAHVVSGEPSNEETAPEREAAGAQLGAPPRDARLKPRLVVMAALVLLVALSGWLLRKQAPAARLSIGANESDPQPSASPTIARQIPVVPAVPATVEALDTTVDRRGSANVTSVPVVSSLPPSSRHRVKARAPRPAAMPTDDTLLDRRK